MKLQFVNRKLHKVDINLPASKSISNRLLILNALSGKKMPLNNLSTAEDTIVLKEILESESKLINVGMAGTAFRFLTAYLSIQEEEYILTGDERMKERPISPLVEALQSLGAEIRYLEKEGYPPLQIKGKKLLGGKVKINAEISSQFVSALMLIAPKLKNGLELELMGNIASSPYIEMTAQLLQDCGVIVEKQQNQVYVHSGIPILKKTNIEADWSSASFFYNFLCCTSIVETTLFFPELNLKSIQGDAVLPQVYSNLGVATTELDSGILIQRSGEMSAKECFDFREFPDLVQPFLVSCAALKRNVEIKGAANLKIKETDRISAMRKELAKLGCKLLEKEEGCLKFVPSKDFPQQVNIQTYNDHRMAMSFAALSARIPHVQIQNPQVVRKSFPGFWTEMKKLGIEAFTRSSLSQ